MKFFKLLYAKPISQHGKVQLYFKFTKLPAGPSELYYLFFYITVHEK